MKIHQRAGWKFLPKIVKRAGSNKCKQGLISASRVENFLKIVKRAALLIDTTAL